ncbi:alpha/beta fold hydrolase [Rhodococcus daqingensis]|uniref:Alpha/beta fold hydrolase n=1 Tax=Rhodococcus daqingensis TaxID=2479363 RepID=A0ABW2RY10_9NOCA
MRATSILLHGFRYRFVCAATSLVVAASSVVIAAPFARAQNCDREPTGTQTSDYNLAFTVPQNLMPDSRFADRSATIRVHRVSPTYARGKCPGVQNLATVLVHGRAQPGSTTFDLRAQDAAGGSLSLQEALARAGIDTFAPDLLGYGRSTRFEDGLDDPANASLPGYGPGDTCATPAAGCDKTRNANIFPLNQQARYLGDGITPPIEGLGVNPLQGELRPHKSHTYFANIDVWVRDIMQVIDDAIAKAQPRANKVVLLGYSFGGPRVARTLYRLGEQADRKVSQLVFVDSLFNRLPGQTTDVNLPTEEAQLPPVDRSTSFPLNISPTGGWDPISPGREPACAGRIPAGAPQALKQQVLELDPLGASWGGSDAELPTGVLRSPTFTLYGWNPTVAATFDQPTLILHGAEDLPAPLVNADNMFNALTSVTNKAVVKVECGSHFMPAEGCDPTRSSRCDDGIPDTIPYGQTSQVWAGPHSTAAAAVAEWVKRGTFNSKECGRFRVNASGIVNEEAPTGCPGA